MQSQITYEKLFDYLREERNNIKLQKLPTDFYTHIIAYLSMKEKSLDSLKESGSLTFDNNQVQLRNAKKIIADIYERREKKIISLAVSKSRTRSQLIDTSALLNEEKLFFKQISIVLDHFRGEILDKILDKKVPQINEQKDSVYSDISSDKDQNESVDEDQDNPRKESADDMEEVDKEIAVKFLQYVDKFVGPDLEILGPFEKDSVVKLSSEVVKIMIEKGYAEPISN